MVETRSDRRVGEVPLLDVRTMRPDEVHRMVDYFHDADDAFLARLGADRAGFQIERSYETTPGWINVHQRVNRWRLDLAGRHATVG